MKFKGLLVVLVVSVVLLLTLSITGCECLLL